MGWVTGAPFIDYLISKLEGELQKCCIKQNLAFKILLINNAPDHPTTFQDLCEYTSPQTQCSNTTEGSKSDIDIKNLLFEENMLVKAVDDKNMIVKEFGKVLLLEMQLHFCVCRLQKKNVPLSVTRL